MIRIHLSQYLIAAALLIGPYCSLAQSNFPAYRATIVELPPPRAPNPYFSFGIGAINDHGQFVGTIEDGLGSQAFLWDGGVRKNLTPLNIANDINNAGQIVGRAEFAGEQRAAIYHDEQITDLGTLPGENSSIGQAINSIGHVTGSSRILPNYHAFYWNGNALQEIGDFYPTDINDNNEIVGFPFSGPGILWRNGVTETFNGNIINNALQYPSNGGMWDGEQTICYDGNPSPHCDLYQGGYDINENAEVVGDDLNEAFIWSKENGLVHLIDLLDPNDQFSEKILNMQFPVGINNNRQVIVQYATIEESNGETKVVPLLLTPISLATSTLYPVPIPVFYFLLAAVSISLISVYHLRRGG